MRVRSRLRPLWEPLSDVDDVRGVRPIDAVAPALLALLERALPSEVRDAAWDLRVRLEQLRGDVDLRRAPRLRSSEQTALAELLEGDTLHGLLEVSRSLSVSPYSGWFCEVCFNLVDAEGHHPRCEIGQLHREVQRARAARLGMRVLAGGKDWWLR